MKELKLPLTGLKDTNNGYTAFTEQEKEIDILLTDKAKHALNKIGLHARLPPKIKANRSVICRKIDMSVGSHTKDELTAEINKCNTNIKVAEITKFKEYTHIFKIELQTTEQAQHVLQNGLLCYNTRIAPSQIEKEEYADLQICFTCYKYESHSTKDCPTPNKIICSECTGQHKHTQCTSNIKKCINCGGSHRTLAMACPTKKQLMRNKIDQNKQNKQTQEEATYSKVVQKTLEKTQEQRQVAPITDNSTCMTAMIMILDAHINNIIQPGTYNKRLNETLRLNNITQVKLPETNISKKLVNLTNIADSLAKIQENIAKEQKTTPVNNDTSSSESDTESETDMEQETQTEDILTKHLQTAQTQTTTIEAQEGKINIYANKTTVRQEDQTATQLQALYKTSRIKFTVQEDSDYTPEQVDLMLYNGKITANNQSIKYVEQSEFRKIRNATKKSPHKTQATKKKHVV